ncbi:copper homeostasis protein [Clostridium cavendishii DSM 21758]|uniref:PF03932 family protein CutC n=1 Tax=Clostridium cavendishii DSM 21758 TaxID=1121302 RepID=A0A1M6VU10_9CLOT|nr:copper homeostasis protein CutC [Clostridium cavendishii]SHK84901.1 copper homeostasis protein [Clostridium cavendishii DSM 21758]
MQVLKEACVGSYIQAINAEKLGADRIELCDNLNEGGTTPSLGTIKLARLKIKVPINVIIRPRGGDYIYTNDEIIIMENDIKLCKDLNVNGVVIGILNNKNEIDIENMKRLIELAKPLSITFHMAFDEIKDKKKAIDDLYTLGVDRILTKGGEVSAIKNKENLKELINYSKDRITILPGGGLTKDNYFDFVKYVGAVEVHGSRIVGNL